MSFVHLHLHTEYSLLDGACRLDRLFDAVKDAGQTSVAITDHGVMYGAMAFYQKAIAAGIKPIIGCEVYVAPGSRFEKSKKYDVNYYHLVLLCKNNVGYQNLIKLVSAGFTEGFYTRPRIDKELLERNSEGLIALSACLAGEIPKLLLYGEYDKAKETAEYFSSVFGKDNFYLEMQNHNVDEQMIVNNGLRKISKETGIKLVCTNDVHYIEKQDSKMQEVLLAVGTGKKLGDEDLMSFQTDEFYLKSENEMKLVFPNDIEAIENTENIAEICNITFEFHKLKLPYIDIGNQDHFEYFREKCYDGLFRNYGNNPDKSITERLEYELSVIKSMGFTDYYLIVSDYVLYAKSKGIPVGPGRGSGAGSLAAYCIGITGIDPIKYDLFFERFLNPERVSMPDFDVDFCYVRREEVIDYVISKYGKDHVSQIVTFGTLAARAAVRDVGRVMNIPYSTCDKVAKLIPNDHSITIERAIKIVPDLKNLYDSDDITKELIDMSRRVEGMPRHASTHAAGVVISDKPVMSYVPLAVNDEATVTQYTMTELEQLGLLKMDFLGLRNLTIIDDCVKQIKEKNIKFDINKIPLNDEKTLKMMGDGNSDGVFQFESEGMKNVLRAFKPENLEDLIAIISLYRPGPRKSIPMYIYNRHHPNEVKYKTPLLKPILDVTYGCIVYQEQVMQIFRELAGYSLGRADIVRRAMSKKKHDVMQKERDIFINGEKDKSGNTVCEGAVTRGVDKRVAEEIYDDISDFSSYAFNKSHAASYAVVSYQTAYLKCHYAPEYMSSLLTSVLDQPGKINQYSAECSRLNIRILVPDVNESGLNFTVSGGNIRFGLLAIKNLGAGLINKIIIERKNGNYTSMFDFCNRISGREINHRALEGLIKSGAMDCLNANRRQMLQSIDEIISVCNAESERSIDGQQSLFDTIEEQKSYNYEMPKVDEMPADKLLAFEKEATGMYLSGHPLNRYLKQSKNLKTVNSNRIIDQDIEDGERVTVLVLINFIKTKTTKSGALMAFVSAEDLYNSVNITIFPKIFSADRSIIKEGNVVIVNGRVSRQEDRPGEIICDRITLATPDKESSVKITEKPDYNKLYIRVNSIDSDILPKINSLLSDTGSDVIIYLEDTKKQLKARKKANFSSSSDNFEKLCSIVGKNNVKTVEL